MEYFNLAVGHTRTVAARLAQDTHWIDYDAPVTRGRAQASCGSVVDVKKFSQAPTCLACRQQQAIYATFEF